MRGFSILFGCAVALGHSVALAQAPRIDVAQTSGTDNAARHDRPRGDSATLKVITAPSDMKLTGLRDGIVQARLCVASTTGRYRLTITSRSGGMLGPTDMPYTITFREDGGVEQVAPITHQSLVFFDGASPNTSDCHAGPNAVIEIRLTKVNIQKTIAGDYFDQLNLSVSPR